MGADPINTRERSAEFLELQDELDTFDAKIEPLDAELSHLREVVSLNRDRIEVTEAEYRIADLLDERRPIWEQRQRVARRFAVVRAVEDERWRSRNRADHARKQIETLERKARVCALLAPDGDVGSLIAELYPHHTRMPSAHSKWGRLARLVLQHFGPGGALPDEVDRQLTRARADLDDAERRIEEVA